MSEINNKFQMLYRGSVKNVYGFESDKYLYFEFSNRYSVFDWGEMPDLLENKGKALALFSKLAFDYLSLICPNHYLGLVDEKNLNELDHGIVSNWMKVNKVTVNYPDKIQNSDRITYDYSIYKNKLTNCLIPLEVIFRFGVPQGGSIIDRLTELKQNNNRTFESYLSELGLENTPIYGDQFQKPIIEFTTKLESTDRFLTYSEAKQIAGLSESEFKSLLEKAVLLSIKLKELLNAVGIKLWDGKFEFAFDSNRKLMLVDAISPDELRLTKFDVHLSKEILRQYYKNSPWYDHVTEAKAIAKKRGVLEWKSICENELKSKPTVLPPQLQILVSQMYQALTNALSEFILKKKVFQECPALDDIIQKIKLETIK